MCSYYGGDVMLVRHAGGLVSFEVADDSALALSIRKRGEAEQD